MLLNAISNFLQKRPHNNRKPMEKNTMQMNKIQNERELCKTLYKEFVWSTLTTYTLLLLYSRDSF